MKEIYACIKCGRELKKREIEMEEREDEEGYYQMNYCSFCDGNIVKTDKVGLKKIRKLIVLEKLNERK